MLDLDRTECHDPSPAGKYLLGCAVLFDNPKFALPSGTAVEAVPTSGMATFRTFFEGPEAQRITVRAANASSPRTQIVASTWAKRSSRVREFRAYIESVSTRALIAESTGREALQAWDSLNSLTSSAIGVPNAAPGNEGELLLVWDSERHHLEIEFGPAGLPTLFYADRITPSASWELDLAPGALLDAAVLRTLTLFSE